MISHVGAAEKRMILFQLKRYFLCGTKYLSHGKKFGLHCEERNVHLHQRLNGNSLATFCQLKNNDPEDPFDTESPEERSMRYCVYYEKESASDPESESESERGGEFENFFESSKRFS